MIHPNFNPYTVRDGIAYIELTQGQTALIDSADLPLIQPYRWHARRARAAFYAVTGIYVDGKQRTLRLHSLILPPLDGMTIDHISRDSLDNRKCNLRHATAQQQAANRGIPKSNTTGVRGVDLHKQSGKWHAQAGKGYTKYNLGYFDNLDDAIAARRSWEEENGILACEVDEERLAACRSLPPRQPKTPKLQKTIKVDARAFSWYKSDQKWHVEAKLDGKRCNVGAFTKLDDAIAARVAWDKAHNIPPA